MISFVITEIFKFRIIFFTFFYLEKQNKNSDFSQWIIVSSSNLFVYKFLLNFLEKCLVDRSTIERMQGSRYSARKSLVLTADARASIQAFERRFFAHTVRQQIVMGAQVWSSCVTPAYRTMDRKDNHIHIRVLY